MTVLSPEQQQQLDNFFAQVEKRAFKMAMIAIKDKDDALDIVQDAMYKLVKNYAEKPSDEWGALFQTILQHRIMDQHRLTQFKRKWFFWRQDVDEHDGREDADSLDLATPEPSAEHVMSQWQQGEQVVKVLETLPIRQQQAFLLRAWEGYDTFETAKIMGCSEGSVKTHYSRARTRLQQAIDRDD